MNCYREFQKKWKDHVMSEICRKLQGISNSLAEAYVAMDSNGDGLISYSEFADALAKFDVGITSEQVSIDHI
jgi:hypothetical protein